MCRPKYADVISGARAGVPGTGGGSRFDRCDTAAARTAKATAAGTLVRIMAAELAGYPFQLLALCRSPARPRGAVFARHGETLLHKCVINILESSGLCYQVE